MRGAHPLEYRTTYQLCGPVLQNGLDLVQNLRRQLGNDLESLQIVENLFRSGRAKNDSTGVRILCDPRQS